MLRATLIAVLALACAATAPAGATTRLVHFQSPSGNLNCIAGTAPVFVDCLAKHAAWPHVRQKPAGCDLDWVAHELSLGRGRVIVGACRGDIGPLCVHNCTTLAYGRSVRVGPIRCRSATDGITCRYVTGRLAGFRIAREGYVIWGS